MAFIPISTLTTLEGLISSPPDDAGLTVEPIVGPDGNDAVRLTELPNGATLVLDTHRARQLAAALQHAADEVFGMRMDRDFAELVPQLEEAELRMATW